jgi:hypothetical protein
VFVREGLAISHTQRGRWQEAIDVVNEALAILGERRLAVADVPLLLAIRARAETGLGDASRARSSGEEAVAVAVRCGARHYEARARIELVRALTADAPSGAEVRVRAELDAARSIAEKLSIRSLLPEVHLEEARLAGAAGDAPRQESQLRRAVQLFSEIGAPARARALRRPTPSV